jgi:predicted CoA-binding protein
VREGRSDAERQGGRIGVPGQQASGGHRGVPHAEDAREQQRLPAAARAWHEVFAINPNTHEVEGDKSYPDLKSIPGGVQAVVIGTRPEIAEDTMRECAELGIEHVWMHRGPGAGSVSDAATEYGRQHGITVIDGGCPLMFAPTSDFGHRIMRRVLAGHVPKQV